MKPVSKLKTLVFCAALPLVLWGCARTEPEPDSLYINLNDYPLYVKNGFEEADITRVPEFSPLDPSAGPWRLIPSRPGDPRRPASIKNTGLPGLSKRVFLSPFKEKDREYTMLIPFTVRAEQFEKIGGKKPFQPGIFLAILGDNWEIFLNGYTVKSEVHLDGEGQIESSRTWRYVSLPLDRSMFTRGTNILAFRIIGSPDYDGTGLCYEQPYYIGQWETIQRNHNEFLVMAFCAVYIFVGIYHFLIFLNRPRDRFNLYYCGFSTALGIYFLMRSHSIYSLIPNTNITYLIEYATVFMALPLLSAFLENLSFGKVTVIAKIYGAFCLLLALSQSILPRPFGDDILRVWWVSDLFGFTYIIGYDMIYAFWRAVDEQRRTAGKPPREVLWNVLVRTPQGNLIIGIIIMAATGIVDILSSFYMNRGVFIFSNYGFFMFTIITTIVLARRFGSLFRRLDTMNTALEKSNMNLETTVRERTRELEHQTEVAKSASQAKSVFLARMSHEIRTPLNAILGLAEVELQDRLPDKTRINLEKIHHSGSHLLEIVNDILDISKIESGNFEIVPAEYELSKMISDTVQLNIVRIGLKQVVFKPELDETIPEKLYGDELRLRQILNNLLSNAFKYTEEGEVRLRIGWERQGGAALLDFTVEDTGRGIKPRNMEKLFSEYTQFDAAANRQVEGTGLGLSIAKGLVEMMGGTITAESEYGKGSVFRVSLPQGIVDGTPVGRETAENIRRFRFSGDRTRSLGNLVRSWMPYGKVLVVDDLPTNLDVMTGLLMPYGLSVDTVLNGREAIARITAGEPRYDLVFMDHMMPEMDGLEAVRFIRHEIDSDYARTVPVIVLTANAIAGNREMFLESGFNDFIPKPIDIKQLDQVLNQWIRDRRGGERMETAGPSAGGGEFAGGGSGGGINDSGIDGEGQWLLSRPAAGLDVNAALNLYGGSGAAYIPILKSFAAHTPPLLEQMDRHLESSSLPDYAVEVHGLKGACSAVCAAGTAALARELEFAAKEGNAALVLSRHWELRRQALALAAELGALLAEWEARRPTREKEWRAEPSRELLARLSAAAAVFNSTEAADILGELEQYRYERGGELITRLREQAENFDYDAIQKGLEEMLAPKGQL
ncbi:MAG: response regulator [Treponema sp.]|jgi:signal transduction histidine kinase/CheY-like chemotaxis protein/HPt (histidine-containing phosphotransfer) domain-containing protein|nr:response regulator [Treponema sp.]